MEMRQKEFSLNIGTWDRFVMADFERKHYPRHVSMLKKSINEFGLLNRNISVWESEGKFHVLDGQHRLLALYSLLLEGFRKGFPITLNILSGKDENEARDKYIQININNKSIVGKDVLKAYENLNPFFFKYLDAYCTHYGSTKDLSYLDVLYAIVYAKTEWKKMRKEDIEEYISNVDKSEVERANQLLENITTTISTDKRHWVYRLAVLRNIFRLYWENYPDIIPKLHSFLKKLSSDKYLETNSRNRGAEALETTYGYMKKVLG